MFRDQVIRLWTVVYDQDPDCIYTFTSWNKVLQGVEGSIRSYIDGCGQVDEIVKNIMDRVAGFASCAFTPMVINNLVISIYGWDIEPSNQIHQVLVKCYDFVDDELKCEIIGLFRNPR